MSFDYSAYYRRVQDVKRLQLPAAAARWLEQWEQPARRREIVLYLGCNILRTPDIAADVIAVFDALGLDFVAVAGVQFCCGITWDRNGDVPKGQAVADATIGRLQAFGPSLVVHWCPSCDVHFNEVLCGRDGRKLGFEVTSAGAFLAERVSAGRMPWLRRLRHRAVMHGHVGLPAHPHGQRRAREDSLHIATILNSIPGITWHGVVDGPAELDYDCGPSVPELPRPDWLALRRELWQRLRATGADLVVTKSHACQREWCDLADADVQVRCYISLVADALGCQRDYPANLMADLKRARGLEQLVQLTRSSCASHGWTEAEARAAIARYDWDGTVSHLPSP
jgi:hypothetical protein